MLSSINNKINEMDINSSDTENEYIFGTLNNNNHNYNNRNQISDENDHSENINDNNTSSFISINNTNNIKYCYFPFLKDEIGTIYFLDDFKKNSSVLLKNEWNLHNVLFGYKEIIDIYLFKGTGQIKLEVNPYPICFRFSNDIERDQSDICQAYINCCDDNTNWHPAWTITDRMILKLKPNTNGDTYLKFLWHDS